VTFASGGCRRSTTTPSCWRARSCGAWKPAPSTPGSSANCARSSTASLDPHFRVEEELLLPVLRGLGHAALVHRIERDHADLRSCLAAAERGELAEVAAFAERLAEHVRFEERELFPRCEEELPDAVLDEVARRAP
jgi:iron-sulfur cluster repair protein YtfE (RIC family)